MATAGLATLDEGDEDTETLRAGTGKVFATKLPFSGG
jgi:hypothetical protein